MPIVSVIMPVYNSERFLKKAVLSVLNQTLGDFELIVIDDGSTDKSLCILNKLARNDDRLIVLPNESNLGIVKSLNRGLEIAQGKYIARMDGDDICEPQRFEKQVEFLESNPHLVGCGTHVYVIDNEGVKVKIYRPPSSHKEILLNLKRGDGGALIHPSILFRRDALSQSGGYNPDFVHAEDVEFFIRLAQVGELANLESCLLRYRVHFKSVNFVHEKEQSESIKKIISIYGGGVEVGADRKRDRFSLYADWVVQAKKEKFHYAMFKYCFLLFWHFPMEGRTYRIIKYSFS